jgi:hypothetical protein
MAKRAPRMVRSLLSLSLAVWVAAGCGSHSSATDPLTGGNSNTAPDTARIPLNDLTNTYRGFQGGLYSGGNTVPATHATIGLARAKAIRPLDQAGNPSASGKYVLLSIGMSNTAQEFCGGDMTTGCAAETFMGQAAADLSVNRSTMVIVNGAQGGRDAIEWITTSSPMFDIVRDQRLAPLNLTEQQVQIVWLKQADAGPNKSLPASDADAYTLETRLGSIVRALKIRYPNLRQVFLTSRIYGGYATSTLNPEPYAYESAFSVKWLIQAQVDQMRTGTADARAGDLNYNGSAPWLAWGPYAWAAGMTPRSDGLFWDKTDFGGDGTHPSTSGRSKVGRMLLDFFKSSQFTRCWFVQGQTC